MKKIFQKIKQVLWLIFKGDGLIKYNSDNSSILGFVSKNKISLSIVLLFCILISFKIAIILVVFLFGFGFLTRLLNKTLLKPKVGQQPIFKTKKFLIFNKKD